MRHKTRFQEEYPRSITPQAGTTIRAGAGISYRKRETLSNPFQNRGAGYVV